MFGSDIIDVVIALAFIYFLLSIVASAVQESIAQVFGWRASTLKQGVKTLLDDDTLMTAVYDNPLIRGLGTNLDSDPSYIKNTRFAQAIVDSLTKLPAAVETTVAVAGATMDTVRTGLETLQPNSAARRQLEVLLRESGGQIDKFQTQIASWFDESMERVSGVYTRHARTVLFFTGLGLALLFNIDTLATAQALATNPSSRDAIVAAVTGAQEAGAQGTSAKDAIGLLNDIKYGIGWDPETYESIESFGAYIPGRVPGWLFTAFAVTLGAPFWFDTLSRFANIRATGNKPKTIEEGKEAEGK